MRLVIAIRSPADCALLHDPPRELHALHFDIGLQDTQEACFMAQRTTFAVSHACHIRARQAHFVFHTWVGPHRTMLMHKNIMCSKIGNIPIQRNQGMAGLGACSDAHARPSHRHGPQPTAEEEQAVGQQGNACRHCTGQPLAMYGASSTAPLGLAMLL